MEYFPISSRPAKTFAQMATRNFVPYLNKKEAAKWDSLLAVDSMQMKKGSKLEKS